MATSPRCRLGHSLRRSALELSHRQEDSPEAVLLSLGAEIRQLSGERPYSQELLLMEQVFVLLLAGFRPQPGPCSRVALVPPSPVPMAPPAPAPALEPTIAALLQAGMVWVALAGQPPALGFPTPSRPA